MIKRTHIISILGCLLVAILFLMLGKGPSSNSTPDEQSAGRPQQASESNERTEAGQSETPLAKGFFRAPDVSKLDAEAGQPAHPQDWIQYTISEEWTDSPQKLAGRQRVRIVQADFKYPHLRLEEAVTVDPETGVETVRLLRASVANHLMLGLKPDVDPTLAGAELEQLGYTVQYIEEGSFILVKLPAFAAAQDQPQAMMNLASLEEFIDYAEPDYLVFTCLAPNDPDYVQGLMWGLDNPGATANARLDADIDAPEAWTIRTDASNIIVAVTDTGVQYNHEDLLSNMWMDGSGNFGFDAYDDDSDPMDVGGHGTHPL